MRTRLFLIPSVFVAALILAACGGDDDDSGTPGGSATTSTTAAPTQTAPDTSPTDDFPSLTPGETVTTTAAPTTPTNGTTYTVAPGDTLYSISQRYGTTVAAIAAANGITDATQIAVGQVLVIPGATTGPTTVPVTQPPVGGPAQVIRAGNTSRNTVALTFDAGSDAGYTVMILDTLAANGITASFGMTGKWADAYPELLKRIVNEGHTLINHSYGHPSFTGNSSGDGLSQAERWDELERTEALVQQLTGATTMPYFRPPFGDYDDSVNADVGAVGYSYNVMWTVDSRGWMGIPAPEITQRCIDNVSPGAIYVFHVGSASADGPALQGIIDGLRAAGYAMSDMNAVLAP